jgi:hypothetical protein
MIENNKNLDIMTPEEVADYLKVSLTWIYTNSKMIGGKKLKGVLRFPKKEDIYECIFPKGEKLVLRLRDEQNPLLKSRIQNEVKCQTSRNESKRGGEKREQESDPFGLRAIIRKETGIC